MAIYTLTEVADIAGMPRSLLKNWTIGRTSLRIVASERRTTGKGSPNLYSLKDIYIVGLAFSLSKVGLALEHVQKVIQHVHAKLPKKSGSVDLRELAWLVIELNSKDGSDIEFNIEMFEIGREVQRTLLDPRDFQGKGHVLVKYLVNVMSLTDEIRCKAAAFYRAKYPDEDEEVEDD